MAAPRSAAEDSLLEERIRSAKVLVVGAGGIGCELLKNLALSGFACVHVIDMDTIELSNLNRQFLFRRHHIGQSKAKVAAAAIEPMCTAPSPTITPHMANVKDSVQFPVAFFRHFDIILNALDNVDARRYVNSICLALNIPLVESGTAGYLGQSSVILPGRTECFDCTPKEVPKTFPVCTIRTAPTLLIHCIVWAKDFLLVRLFGGTEGTLDDAIPAGEAVDEAVRASLQRESESFAQIAALGGADHAPLAYPREVFAKVFSADIATLCSIDDLWRDREAPLVLALPPLEDGDSLVMVSAAEDAIDQQAGLSLAAWTALFLSACERLRRRFYTDGTPIAFDKDDADTMDFVAAAANIRAHVFHIKGASHFECKAMAGNIIPAIGTTNAIVAGMIALQAFNVLTLPRSGDGALESLSTAFVTHGMQRGALFACERLQAPNAACPVCRVDRATARVNDVGATTLSALIEAVAGEYACQLGGCPASDLCAVTVSEGSRILYDPDALEANLERTLEALSCTDCKMLRFDYDALARPLVVLIEGGGGGKSSTLEVPIAITFVQVLPPAPLAVEEEEAGEESIEEPPAKARRISDAPTPSAGAIVITEGDDDCTIVVTLDE